MRKRGRDAAHFILLLLLTAFILLAANLAVFVGLYAGWRADIPFGAEAITENLSVVQGKYTLSEEMRQTLERDGLFAMLLSQEGHILWSERLPAALEREYTLQDVALFTRYYLDDYPVHTYVVPEGLLVVGSGKHTTWKYTLEYNEAMVRRLVRQMPLVLLVNIALLIAVPLFIQRSWIRRREEERTEWIAGVSHDIRTPLTLILGHADALRQYSDDASIVERAGAIERHGLRIRALIANLNTSSKLDFGMGDYKKTAVKIDSLIRKTAADIMNQNGDDRYCFSLEIEEGLRERTILANEALFQRMLENLIYNAIQHNPGGCDISVRLETDKARPQGCVLQISDNGQGASEEALKALNRGAHSRANKLGDHGIGLRLVKQIAQYHAWRVHFSNCAPHGFQCSIWM